MIFGLVFFFKQKTAYEMRISDWSSDVCSSDLMLEEVYRPWIELLQNGTGGHCGECGCWNKTPHDVFLAWFRDVLDILTSNGIGYAIWEFSGDFGVLNSRREDVEYENWQGQHLDRKMLNLLMKY